MPESFADLPVMNSLSVASSAVVADVPPRRRRGRPALGGPFFFLVADLALMLRLDVAQVLALLECERSRVAFFPSARRSAEPGGWRVPAGNVRRLVGAELRPMLRVREVMRLLRFSRERVMSAVKRKTLPSVCIDGELRFSFSQICMVMDRGTAADR